MNAIQPPSGTTTASFWLALVSAGATAILAAGIWPSDSIWQKLIGATVSMLVMLGYSAGRRNVDEAHNMPSPDQRVSTVVTTVTVPPAAPSYPPVEEP